MTPSPPCWKIYSTERRNPRILVVLASQLAGKNDGSPAIGHTEVERATEAPVILRTDTRIEQRWWLNMTALPKKQSA